MEGTHQSSGVPADLPGADTTDDLSRRGFLKGSGAALVATGLASSTTADDAEAQPVADQAAAPVPRTLVRFSVNGDAQSLDVEDRSTLADVLRDRLGLTGTKIGCERGECGACTVLVDGLPIYSCSTLAVWMEGRAVRTVEGLAQDGEISTLQRAFMQHNAAQCGYCTPGQLMAATALLERNPTPAADEVRRALVGNLCRCSNYNAIVEAVMAAASIAPRAGGAE